MADDKKDDDKKDDVGAKAGELFFKSRTVLVTGGIDDKLAAKVTTQLIALAEDSDDPINIFISSPGGHVESGDMIHDCIKFITPKVRILGTGWVASAGALIYVAAEKEDRYSLPNTRYMLHQPWGGVGGKGSDVEIQAQQILAMRERLNKIFADATGQSLKKITEDTDRDYWLTATDAVDYGIVGKIITSQKELS